MTSIQTTSNRNERIDFYKGILMWGVVWGHTITSLLNGAQNDIGIHPIFRTYDMPFFMLISGLFLSYSIKKYSFFQLIKNKITTIAIPTILWTLVLSKFSSIVSWSYYFLWAVFLSAMIVCAFNKSITDKRWQMVVYAVLIILFHVLPFNIANLPYLFPYFVLGYYGYNLLYDEKMKSLYILPFYILGLCFWNGKYNIWNAGANVIGGGTFILLAILYRTFMALSGMIVAKGIFDFLYMYLSDNHPSVCSLFVNFGKETLALYILHVIVLSKVVGKTTEVMIRMLGYNMWETNHLFLGYFIAPLLSFAIMMLLLWLIKWCKRHRYTDKLFGFKI